MKATFDLPPDLLREMKLRAVREGRKFKDLAAELLRRGLAAPAGPTPPPPKPKIQIPHKGLPLVHCSPGAPASRMTGADLLALEQAALHQEDLQRLGHSL